MASPGWMGGARNLALQPDAPPRHFRIRDRDRRQQRLRIGVQRRGIEFARRCGLDDAAEIHHRDAPADMLDDRQVMGDEEISEPDLLLQVLQQIDDLGLDRYIQRRHRLIADDQFGFDRERPRDTDALALAAGEFVRMAADMIRLQADGLEQIHDALFELLPGLGQFVNDHGFADDRADAHARIERRIGVLKDDLDIAAQDAQLIGRQRPDLLAFEIDLAGSRFDQAKHATPGGRLAAAGLADKPQRFAAGDLKIDAVDRADTAGLPAEQAALERKFLGEAPDTEQPFTHRTTVSSARIQATLWPGSSSRKGGCASRHSSMASRQRAAKRQPAGGLISFGTTPAMVSRRVLRTAAMSSRGIERIKPWV